MSAASTKSPAVEQRLNLLGTAVHLFNHGLCLQERKAKQEGDKARREEARSRKGAASTKSPAVQQALLQQHLSLMQADTAEQSPAVDLDLPVQERKAKQEGDKARREEARSRKGEGVPDFVEPPEPVLQMPTDLLVRLLGFCEFCCSSLSCVLKLVQRRTKSPSRSGASGATMHRPSWTSGGRLALADNCRLHAPDLAAK